MSRVLMVLRPDRGGAFNHVADLSAALASKGLDVIVCGPVAHRAADLAVSVVPLSIERQVSAQRDLAAVAAFARLVRRVRPDLIHAHGSKGSLVARLARFAAPRTPVICTPHLYPFDNYLTRAHERRLYRAVEVALAPLASRVISVCEAERALAASVGPAWRTRTVHNGVAEVPEVAPHPVYAELGDAPVIAAVAELRQSKGISTLLDAMALLRDRVPSARLVVAGDGDERVALERQAARLGLADTVVMVGHTDGPAAVFSGAALFVNPAWAEAFPYTIIEAMSHGRPVVATDVGGSREAVAEGITGLLVPPRDAAALAAALERALSDPALRDRLGAAGRRRYFEEFTLERMVERTLAVYAELGVRAPLSV